MDKFYVIGFDLGTTSIGWSVADRKGNVLKVSGKPMWGVLKFDEGQTAKARRLARAARRRNERRRERIDLLQGLTAPLVLSVDENFFRRLDLSFLLTQGKDPSSVRTYRYNLFNGEITDRRFYAAYPTIYHLRRALCEKKDEKFDPRYVYLAMHHIVKYRGNFLREEPDLEVTGDGVACLLRDLLDRYDDFSDVDKEEFIRIYAEKGSSRDKKKALLALGGKDNDALKIVAPLLLGLSADVGKILGVESGKTLQFGKDDFDEKFEAYRGEIDGKYEEMILDAKSVFTERLAVNILGEGNKYVYQGMIAGYEKHKEQLIALKTILKPYPDLYAKVFKMPRRIKKENEPDYFGKATYTNYMRTDTARTKYRRGVTREDFYNFLKSEILCHLPESTEKTDIEKEIELDDFLRKQNDVDNGAIPYQYNKRELELIIDNQGKFYPELLEQRDKIISLLTFRRPYYVGVLNPDSPSYWLGQTLKERVYPWNFSDLIDEGKAQKAFIDNLVGKDKYTGEKVLPKESPTYQRYIVLNELNDLRLDGKRLDVKIKQTVFDELVLKNKTVTAKAISDFLKKKWNLTGALTGLSDEKKLNGSMKTLITLGEIIGENLKNIPEKVLDEIAMILTVFPDERSKKAVLTDCLKEYKKIIGPEKIKKLAQKKLSGWGKYSYKLLRETLSVEARPRDVLTLLYETDKEMMGILYDEALGFSDRTVNRSNAVEKPDYENIIEDLYASPAVKRTVWQAYKLTREILKIIGCPPENIFIETTRDDAEKKKKGTRKENVEKLYKEIKRQLKEKKEEFGSIRDSLPKMEEELKQIEKLDKEKVYLYFMQCGKCLYSGEDLSLGRLDEYEVDHILPRSLLWMDGFENKALVKRSENQRKRDLALTFEVQQKMLPWWTQLKKAGLISEAKFRSLTKEHWTEADAGRFIDRQLVETTQINKAFADVLSSAFPELRYKVKTIRASLGTQVRKYHMKKDPVLYGNFFKLRDLNDFHHAKDAYIVACMGLFTTEYFSVWGNDKNILEIKRILEDRERDLTAEKVKEYVNKRHGLVIDALVNRTFFSDAVDKEGEYPSSANLYDNMVRNMDRYDIRVVRVKERFANADFYNIKPISVDKASDDTMPLRYVTGVGGKKVPLDPKKYGGYSGVQQAYFLRIAYMDKKKMKKELIGIPVMEAIRSEKDKGRLLSYVKEQYGDNSLVIGPPVRKYQRIDLNGQSVYIVSASEVQNACQLIVDKKFDQMLYYIEKGVEDIEEKVSDFHTLAKDFLWEYLKKLEKFYPLYKSKVPIIRAFTENKFDALTVSEKRQYISCLLTMVSGRRIGDEGKPFKMNGWGRLCGKTIATDNSVWYDESVTGFFASKPKNGF